MLEFNPWLSLKCCTNSLPAELLGKPKACVASPMGNPGLPHDRQGTHHYAMRMVYHINSLIKYMQKEQRSSVCVCVCVCVWWVAQLCPTLCNPMDGSLPGSSVHGILQARILGWVAIPFSRWSSWPRNWTQVSCIVGRFHFTVWATREAQKISRWLQSVQQ